MINRCLAIVIMGVMVWIAGCGDDPEREITPPYTNAMAKMFNLGQMMVLSLVFDEIPDGWNNEDSEKIISYLIQKHQSDFKLSYFIDPTDPGNHLLRIVHLQGDLGVVILAKNQCKHPGAIIGQLHTASTLEDVQAIIEREVSPSFRYDKMATSNDLEPLKGYDKFTAYPANRPFPDYSKGALIFWYRIPEYKQKHPM